ncbi:MAG: hypothetical protein ACRDVG_12765 [Jatrophihabitantaceae bacterium]
MPGWMRTLAGMVSALTLVVSCSSTTSGKPDRGGITADTRPSPTSLTPGTGDTHAFCTRFRTVPHIDFGHVDHSALAQYQAYYDRLAAVAPPAIKGDVITVRDYFHSVLSGHQQPAGAFATAYSHLVAWVAQNCH